jgi:hypothetical protein
MLLASQLTMASKAAEGYDRRIYSRASPIFRGFIQQSKHPVEVGLAAATAVAAPAMRRRLVVGERPSTAAKARLYRKMYIQGSLGYRHAAINVA